MTETVNIEKGRSIELSGGRVVFIAPIPDRELLAVGLRNEEGDLTKITLSLEAAAALSRLISDPTAGKETEPPRSGKAQVYGWKAAVITTEQRS